MTYVGTDDAGLMDFNAAVYADFALTDSVSVGGRVAWMSLSIVTRVTRRQILG